MSYLRFQYAAYPEQAPYEIKTKAAAPRKQDLRGTTGGDLPSSEAYQEAQVQNGGLLPRPQRQQTTPSHHSSRVEGVKPSRRIIPDDLGR